jgi:branched-subunit amino acid aminotransferase/4-amino-4-deoxychorismate lyase
MRIPITNMGFQLGDMCYHAIHVHKGSFFRLKDHLDRWETSISKRCYTSLGYDREQLAEVLHGCVACGNLRDSMVTFVAPRGSPSPTHNDFADFVFLLRGDDDAARILGTLTVTAEREPAHMQAELVQTLHQKSRLAATVEFECPPNSATNFVISISSSSSKL